MPRPKLTMEKAQEIRRIFREQGPPLRVLAEAYGVTIVSIRQILRGETWKNGDEPVEEQLPNHAIKLSDDDVRNIRYMAENGIPHDVLAMTYDVHPRYVRLLVRRESRGYVK